MKLVSKLVLGLTLGIGVVLAVHGALTVDREVVFFEADKKHDGYLLAHAMAEAMAQVQKNEGLAAAVSFLAMVDARDADIEIHWIPPVRLEGRMGLSRALYERLDSGEAVATIERPGRLTDELHTFIRVPSFHAGSGAIEIIESLADRDKYVWTSATRLGVTMVVILLICAALALALGHFWVGRPMAMLIAKTQRVAGENFSAPVVIAQHDELAELGAALNAMSEDLSEARRRRDAEYAKRLSTEAELRHAERLATVGKLASGVAHEIGTPLNVIAGHAKMIALRQVEADDAVDSGRTILEQTERITHIIKQMLGFARRKGPKTTTVELGQLVRDSAALLETFAKSRGVTILTPSNGPPQQALVDPGQVQQVLTNLMTNGIQAMPGGGKLTIGVTSRTAQPPPEIGQAAAEYRCITVADEGCGIEAHDRAHVFEPFFTTKDVGEGTGLGLSVAHSIVREHHGWIEIESEVGEGTRFAVFLPEAVGAHVAPF